FESLSFNELESAEAFYENMRAKKNYNSPEVTDTKLDKTEKLLAIDFVLGEPGMLNDLINKLCLDQNSRLTKEGIYRVLGEILIGSPHNTKKYVTRGLEESRREWKFTKKSSGQW